MVCCVVCDSGEAPAAPGILEQLARAASPRVTPCGASAVVFDVSGLSRVCGPPEVVAHELMTHAGAQGVPIRLAIAGTVTAAWVLAHARAGSTLVVAGGEATALAPLPVAWLASVIELDRYVRPREHDAGTHTSPSDALVARRQLKVCREHLTVFERWGIRTCADLAALPRADVHARLGSSGVRLHLAACGEDVAPLVPVDETRVFVDRVELEWPIEGLEPLSFVLARQCERLSRQLEQADRGAVTLRTALRLTTRAVHERTLALPAPMRDAKVLRTLILLDLESHPPAAGIDVVELQVDVTPGRIVQGSLLARAVPAPEQLSTLLARLSALCGEGRVGAPAVLDTHDGRPCAVTPFRPPSETIRRAEVPPDAEGRSDREPVAYLRRLRLPMAVRVTTDRGMPTRVVLASRFGSGEVRACAGPWRTSGGWWDLRHSTTWDRDEWDVELTDGTVCRLVRHRATGQWEVDGVFD